MGIENWLFLDTAGDELMLGIAEDGEMTFSHRAESGSQRRHSAMLTPLIKTGLDKLGIPPDKLTAVGINTGPGSFTGIRTGIATARTMGQFLEIPVHAFTTFELLAGSIVDSVDTKSVAVYIDALRNRAYTAVLGFDSSGPFYLQEPALQPLDAPSPKEEAQSLPILASQSLMPYFTHPAFTGQRVEAIEELEIFTPNIMLNLLDRYPEAFEEPWSRTLPLYLQEPNITMKKKA